MSKIYVLNQGAIVEQGTHQELLNKNGLYAEMWDKQHSINLTLEQRISSININYLNKIPILQCCTKEFLEDLSDQFIVETYDANDVIFKQDSFGDNFYLIARGMLEVWKNEKSDHPQKLVAVLSEGDYFGELALLYSDTRNATIKARTPCVLLTITRSQFEKLLEQVPAIKAEIEKIALKRKSGPSA